MAAVAPAFVAALIGLATLDVAEFEPGGAAFTRDAAFARVHVAFLEPPNNIANDADSGTAVGSLHIPALGVEYVAIEVGASGARPSAELLDAQLPKGFLVTFEPYARAYARLLAHGMRAIIGDATDTFIPLSMQHARGMVLPVALSAAGGTVGLAVSTHGECTGVLGPFNRTSARGAAVLPPPQWAAACGRVSEVVPVASYSLRDALRLVGGSGSRRLPVRLLRIGVAPNDLALLRSVPGPELLARVEAVQLRVPARRCAAGAASADARAAPWSGCVHAVAILAAAGYVADRACPDDASGASAARTADVRSGGSDGSGLGGGGDGCAALLVTLSAPGRWAPPTAPGAAAPQPPRNRMKGRLRWRPSTGSPLTVPLHVASLDADGREGADARHGGARTPDPGPHTSAFVEIGCSDRDVLQDSLGRGSRAGVKLLSFEPLLDKWAALMHRQVAKRARGAPEQAGHTLRSADGRTPPAGAQHARGLVLPFAVAPRANVSGPGQFRTGLVSGCSSLADFNPEVRWGRWCRKLQEVRAVPVITLERALSLAGTLPVTLLRMDMQGLDFGVLRSAQPAVLRARVRDIVFESRSPNCPPLYRGQEPCDEALQYLRSIGFAPIGRTAALCRRAKPGEPPTIQRSGLCERGELHVRNVAWGAAHGS